MSMSIDSLNALYNNNYSTGRTNALEESLNTDLSKATDDELMDVCKEFEAYFTEQMFKAMRKMIPETEKQSASTQQLQDYYMDEMVKSMAESSAENNSLGLAQTLYEQMKRNYNL